MKYDINDMIYFMRENKVCCERITSRIAVEHSCMVPSRLYMATWSFQHDCILPEEDTIRRSGNYYIANDIMMREDEIYDSREKLLETL